MQLWVIGIDLGRTKIVLGLVSPTNEIVARGRLPTNLSEGPKAAVERIAIEISTLKGALPADARIAAVGICSPGPVDHEAGLIVDPPNMIGWHAVPFRQMLSDRINLPVVLEHDAKAAALGEFHFGAGRAEQHMVYIVAGTGVGAAIIIDGKLYRGMHNFAGEVGQVTIDKNDEAFGTNVRGCVQEYLCGPALARHYEEMCRQTPEFIRQNQVTGEQVAQLAAAGDKLALQVMNQAGEALGIAVGSMGSILDIELFVIGGSVAKAGDLLLNPAREILQHYCLESIAGHMRIEPVALGDDSPILGCAWLARQAAEVQSVNP
jgi:glucokinase